MVCSQHLSPTKGIESSEQASDQQVYKVEAITQDYEEIDIPDRLHNEMEMNPNVVYGAGDQKPSEIKMKMNQVYGY